MQINFHPETVEPALIDAAKVYQSIWDAHGENFIAVLQSQTGLKLPDSELNALVWESTSRSHPLVLRASYPLDIKRAVIVHELGHRILTANNLTPEFGKDFHVQTHKLLYLFLYEVYLKLFGAKLANKVVEWESNLRPSYRECWEWALDLGEKERDQRFKNIKANQKNWLSYLEGNT